MSFKNKVADFLTLSVEGYYTMSPKEVALWYAAAIPVNVAYFKLIRRQRFAPAIGLGLVMTSALMLRSFTLGLRLRKGECPPAPMWEPKPSDAVNTRKADEEPRHGSWVYSAAEGRFVQVCTNPDAPSCSICEECIEAQHEDFN